MTEIERKFGTVRQVAALKLGLSECKLRERIAQGRCPGIRVGNRFLVHIPALLEQLDRESLAEVKQ